MQGTGEIGQLREGRTGRLLLALILVTAAVLRFYRFTEIPFTYDELSALFRTRYDTFGELIRHGVMVDGHPAGVQVFLYYWVRWFGETPWVVKLPFAVMGWASVYLMYRLARMWFGMAAGLLAAAVMAVAQYGVMYSQIARPYGSGLFFSLWMLLFWSRMVRSRRITLRDAAGYVSGAVLLIYDHHFGALFAAVTLLTGLIPAPAALRRRWLALAAALVLLYLPHLPVFFRQLAMKGVGEWLAPPRASFLPDYLAYLFNFSPFFLVLMALLFFSPFLFLRGRLRHRRMILINGIWFVVVLTTGFLYFAA